MNQFTVNELSTPHGRNHYRVEGFLNGKRKRLFRRTRELAEHAARKLNAELEREGHRLTDIPNEIRAEALACVERLAGVAGASLTKAVDYYLAHHDLRARSIPVAQAWAEYVANETARSEGKLGRRLRVKSLQSILQKGARFEADFGAEQLCDLNSDRLQNWLDTLLKNNGEAFSLASKETYRLVASGFFTFCVRRKWIGIHPMTGIASYRDHEDKQPGIFVASEAAKLLEAADSDTLPVIAIGLFAGLRPTEVWRLSWSDVIWHKNQIDVKGNSSKTGRYRFVPIEENLQAWLAPYRNTTGRVWNGSQSNLTKCLREVRKAAGIASWPKDALRHSYGSHYYAMSKNAAETANNMGHEDTKMLFKHYNNRRSPEEGAAYFAIRPVEVPQMLAAA